MTPAGAPLGLFADLYELTMAAAFHAEGCDDIATFDLFVRSLPDEREFLVVCGVETALDDLERFTYGPDEVEYLGSLGLFADDFLERLASFRFGGEVRAMAEGDLAFGGEPLLSVTGPIVEVQLLETLLINTVGLETMLASKAARIAQACAGRAFVDFSARRDHGRHAALAAARASAVAGASATSLVEAGRAYGLALSGTMAHSYVMAHADEESAFRAYLRQFGTASVLLVDTYDIPEGTRRAVAAMDAEGVAAKGVRLDSGDLAVMAREARAILDAGGYPEAQILVSGDLDEDRITALLAADAPIDAFGVGTRLGTSSDHPYLSMVYKLVEQAGKPRMKLSEGKATLPGRKQVWRTASTDVIALADEDGPPDGRPLLAEVMRDGRPAGRAGRSPADRLAAARERCAASLAALRDRPPTVTPSAELRALAATTADLVEGEHGERHGSARRSQ